MPDEKIPEEPKVEPYVITPPKKIGDDQPKGIATQLSEINEKISVLTDPKATKVKQGKFKMPSGFKSKLKKLAKTKQAYVLYLRDNLLAEPIIAKIDNGMLIVGDLVHDASAAFVWLYMGRYPMYIVPEWDILPIGKDRLKGITMFDQSSNYPQRVIIRMIESREKLEKLAGKGFGKAWIWILIGAAILGFVLFANKGG